ncbi:MAG: HNH endonuclease [Bryobacteraceae bacterium]
MAIEPWEKSTVRRMKGGRGGTGGLERGPNGYPLCRWCRLETSPPRRTFCSDYCVHEWRMRTDPGYLRECLFARDKGVCALCGIDTVDEYRRIRKLRGGKCGLALADWGATRKRSSLWDADHILPVAEGGGECDLSNLRTLCLRCHRRETAALRERSKAARPGSSAGAAC